MSPFLGKLKYFTIGVVATSMLGIFVPSKEERIILEPIKIDFGAIHFPESCFQNSLAFKAAYTSYMAAHRANYESRLLVVYGTTKGGNMGGHVVCVFYIYPHTYIYDINTGSYDIGRDGDARGNLLHENAFNIANRLTEFTATSAEWIEVK